MSPPTTGGSYCEMRMHDFGIKKREEKREKQMVFQTTIIHTCETTSPLMRDAMQKKNHKFATFAPLSSREFRLFSHNPAPNPPKRKTTSSPFDCHNERFHIIINNSHPNHRMINESGQNKNHCQICVSRQLKRTFLSNFLVCNFGFSGET